MNLHEQRLALINYLHAKITDCDWHGVSDAANDLRVLEARISAGALEPMQWFDEVGQRLGPRRPPPEDK